MKRAPAGRISILLPTRDRPEHLRTLLEHLLEQSERAWDLVLVEDGAGAEDVLAEFRERLVSGGHAVEVAAGPRDGPARASQAGFARCRGGAVLRMDDDLRPRPDFLARLRLLLEMDASFGAVGGNYPDPAAIEKHGRPDAKGQEMLDLAAGRILRLDRGFEPIQRQTQLPRPDESPYEVDHLHSAWLGRRAAIEKAGGFSIEYDGPALREETDLSVRVRMAGFRLAVDPGAVALHCHAPSGGTRAYDAATRRAYEEANNALFNRRMEEWSVKGLIPFVVDARKRK